MPDFLCVTTLPHLDGYARDDVKFSAVFIDEDADGANAMSKMVQFLNTPTTTGGRTLASYVATTRTRAANACFVQAFDISAHLDGSPHGSAVATQPFTLGAASGAALKNIPAEVAAVVSYRANTYGSSLEVGPIAAIPTPIRAQEMGAPATHSGRTRPRARLRGRLYFGPLMDNAVGASAPEFRARLDNDFRVTLGEAAARMAAPGSSPSISQGVWSRRNGNIHVVETVAVDDGFDIQRRRGEKAVNKTTYTV